MNYSKLMDTAVLAGEIMLKSGAESYRVEDTMNYILRISDLETVEAFAINTALVATLNGPQIQAVTIVKRIRNRGTDLNKIYEVNNISRSLIEGRLTVDDAYNALKKVQEEKNNELEKNVSVVALAASFALLLGGGFWDVVCAALNGLLLVFSMKIGAVLGLTAIIRHVLSAAGVAAGAVFLNWILAINLNTEMIIIGTMMPLMPGTAITNAIRDTLRGDYLSGGAKAMEAFVIAASIAIGVGIGLVVSGGNAF